jgi:DNA processing protein
MRGQDEAAAWIALRGARGVGDVAAGRVIPHFGDVFAVLSAPEAALVAAGLTPAVARAIRAARPEDAADEVTRLTAHGARVIPCTDDEYPALLRQVVDAPLYLIARGERLLDAPALAVVGARHATPYGKDIAARFGEELAQAGVTVVSGLARGIDGAAHAGALRGGGHTVAVLGSGIDVVYPPEHAELAAEIVRAGTLLSERPLGSPPLAEHFPARNRIIAGMTHGTLVVEAADRSGSQITARLAVEQGREVFAVPGRIDSPLSVGTHRLIQEGAKLVGSVEDILAELLPALRARGATTTTPRTAAPPDDDTLTPLLAAGPLPADELIRRSGLPPGQVLTRILDLELRGVLVQLPGKQFQLARR